MRQAAEAFLGMGLEEEEEIWASGTGQGCWLCGGDGDFSAVVIVVHYLCSWVDSVITLLICIAVAARGDR